MKSKGLFMKLIVVFCIAYVVRVIECGLNICTLNNISPNSIVTATITFFGVELALCVVKRIWSKEDKTENIQETTEDFSNNEIGTIDTVVIPIDDE